MNMEPESGLSIEVSDPDKMIESRLDGSSNKGRNESRMAQLVEAFRTEKSDIDQTHLRVSGRAAD